MRTLDWIIVGGGPHGVCAARALRAAGADLNIVEASGELMQRWRARADAVAMTGMRSPVVHHVGKHPTDLHEFVHRPEQADVGGLARPLLRPSHAAFVRHTQHVIAEHKLEQCLVHGRVEGLHPDGACWCVRGQNFELRARRVLVATGSNRLRVPDWAQGLRERGAPVEHVFAGAVASHCDIVGGGISSVQRALDVLRRTGQRVRIWARRALTIKDFDFEPRWSTPRFLGWWSRLDVGRRSAFLVQHSGRGSLPSGLWRRLEKAMRSQLIEFRRVTPRVHWHPNSGELILNSEGQNLPSHGLTLATGFEREHLQGWLQAAGAGLKLPTDAGLPCLGQDMSWGRGLHVTGPLAALRLGPMASNLIGARWAASMLPGVKMLAR